MAAQHSAVRETATASEHTPASGPVTRVRRFASASGRARFQQYTRVGLYTFALLELPLFGTWAFSVQDVELWVRALILTAGLGHIAAVWWLTRDALRWYLGHGPRPHRPLATALAVTLAGQAVGALLLATDRTPVDAAMVLTWFPMFVVGPVVLALPLLRGVAVSTGLVLLTVPAVVLFDGRHTAVALLYLVTGCLAFTVTYRTSGWSLRVLQELDEARQTQARLAVAEERLRFSRDMHDVLGRNLSVIALKSELAQQLAQRGSPAAGDQMTEVQRIARESQQEMRAVLRGYRETDLHAEIAGARGVLEAAGVTCTVVAAPASTDLPVAVRTALGWVVREGATNVLRHSDAGHCAIRLDRDRAGAVLLTLENDGVRATTGAGTDPGADADAPAGEPAPTGSGLAGLRERLTALDGTLTAAPGPRSTFRLTAHLPVTPKG